MNPKLRQKLCSNCDGEIDLDVIVCPYCAADLREEKPEQRMSPPGNVRPLTGGQPMTQSLFPSVDPSREPAIVTEPAPAQPVAAAAPEEKSSRLIGPILLFAVGAQLCLLGLLLALFSENGSLVLRWDARLWFLYIFASVPFLIFGYRSISKL
jgi:hypothetical protein